MQLSTKAPDLRGRGAKAAPTAIIMLGFDEMDDDAERRSEEPNRQRDDL